MGNIPIRFVLVEKGTALWACDENSELHLQNPNAYLLSKEDAINAYEVFRGNKEASEFLENPTAQKTASVKDFFQKMIIALNSKYFHITGNPIPNTFGYCDICRQQTISKWDSQLRSWKTL